MAAGLADPPETQADAVQAAGAHTSTREVRLAA